MRLDQDIRRFRIDFERFFTGNIPIPPEQRRINIQNQIKELRTVRLKAVAHRFRFNSLEAKFNALMVLFNRRLREFELGRGATRPTETPDSEFDPESGIVIDKKPSSEAAAALYQSLYGGSSSGPKADFDRFQGYLAKQAQQIRKKTGCNQVRFRVASEDGKMKLKAKPV
jgi:hypothetical protein